MKNTVKQIGIIALIAAIGFLFLTCDTGMGGTTTGRKVRAIGLDCIAYTMDTSVDNRSSRSVQLGGVYIFTKIEPNKGSGGFDSTNINVTVQKIESIGNQKEKVTLKRSDTGGVFYITFDKNGEMIGIQGLAGCKDGFLTPFVSNNSLDGAWFGWNPIDEACSITIKGNKLWLIIHGDVDTYQEAEHNFKTNPPTLVQTKVMELNPDGETWSDVSDDPTKIGTYKYQFFSSNPNKLTTWYEEMGDLEQIWTRVPTN